MRRQVIQPDSPDAHHATPHTHDDGSQDATQAALPTARPTRSLLLWRTLLAALSLISFALLGTVYYRFVLPPSWSSAVAPMTGGQHAGSVVGDSARPDPVRFAVPSKDMPLPDNGGVAFPEELCTQGLPKGTRIVQTQTDPPFTMAVYPSGSRTLHRARVCGKKAHSPIDSVRLWGIHVWGVAC